MTIKSEGNNVAEDCACCELGIHANASHEENAGHPISYHIRELTTIEFLEFSHFLILYSIFANATCNSNLVIGSIVYK